MEMKEPKCPVCKTLFSVSFLLLAMFFSEEHKQAGGKQVQCPSCNNWLWVDTDGKIKALLGIVIVPPLLYGLRYKIYLWMSFLKEARTRLKIGRG